MISTWLTSGEISGVGTRVLGWGRLKYSPNFLVVDFSSVVISISGTGISCWIIGVSFSKGSTISGNVGSNSGVDSTFSAGVSVIFDCGIDVLSSLSRLNLFKNPSSFDFADCGIGLASCSSFSWLISGCGISISSENVSSNFGYDSAVKITSGIVT